MTIDFNLHFAIISTLTQKGIKHKFNKRYLIIIIVHSYKTNAS